MPDQIANKRGLPEAIVLDNRLEPRRRAFAVWSAGRGMRQEFIQLGKPVKNADVECFNLSDHPKPATDYHLKTGQRE